MVSLEPTGVQPIFVCTKGILSIARAAALSSTGSACFAQRTIVVAPEESGFARSSELFESV